MEHSMSSLLLGIQNFDALKEILQLFKLKFFTFTSEQLDSFSIDREFKVDRATFVNWP